MELENLDYNKKIKDLNITNEDLKRILENYLYNKCSIISVATLTNLILEQKDLDGENSKKYEKLRRILEEQHSKEYIYGNEDIKNLIKSNDSVLAGVVCELLLKNIYLLNNSDLLISNFISNGKKFNDTKSGIANLRIISEDRTIKDVLNYFEQEIESLNKRSRTGNFLQEDVSSDNFLPDDEKKARKKSRIISPLYNASNVTEGHNLFGLTGDINDSLLNIINYVFATIKARPYCKRNDVPFIDELSSLIDYVLIKDNDFSLENLSNNIKINNKKILDDSGIFMEGRYDYDKINDNEIMPLYMQSLYPLYKHIVKEKAFNIKSAQFKTEEKEKFIEEIGITSSFISKISEELIDYIRKNSNKINLLKEVLNYNNLSNYQILKCVSKFNSIEEFNNMIKAFDSNGKISLKEYMDFCIYIKTYISYFNNIEFTEKDFNRINEMVTVISNSKAAMENGKMLNVESNEKIYDFDKFLKEKKKALYLNDIAIQNNFKEELYINHEKAIEELKKAISSYDISYKLEDYQKQNSEFRAYNNEFSIYRYILDIKQSKISLSVKDKLSIINDGLYDYAGIFDNDDIGKNALEVVRTKKIKFGDYIYSFPDKTTIDLLKSHNLPSDFEVVKELFLSMPRRRSNNILAHCLENDIKIKRRMLDNYISTQEVIDIIDISIKLINQRKNEKINDLIDTAIYYQECCSGTIEWMQEIYNKKYDMDTPVSTILDKDIVEDLEFIDDEKDEIDIKNEQDKVIDNKVKYAKITECLNKNQTIKNNEKLVDVIYNTIKDTDEIIKIIEYLSKNDDIKNNENLISNIFNSWKGADEIEDFFNKYSSEKWVMDYATQQMATFNIIDLNDKIITKLIDISKSDVDVSFNFILETIYKTAIKPMEKEKNSVVCKLLDYLENKEIKFCDFKNLLDTSLSLDDGSLKVLNSSNIKDVKEFRAKLEGLSNKKECLYIDSENDRSIGHI